MLVGQEGDMREGLVIDLFTVLFEMFHDLSVWGLKSNGTKSYSKESVSTIA
jgi:hypothetical protein